MPLKEKIVGILIIVLGALPFLIKMEFLKNITFLSYLTPGEIIYQIVLVLLGVLLIWNIKPKIQTRY